MDLRANTAVDVLIGPFLDSTNGDDEENGLTLNQSDILLSKNGQALTQKSDVTAAVNDSKGFYNCELDATDTNTEGCLKLVVHVTGALLVKHTFNVMSEAAWDSLYAPKDTGFMDVNVKAVSEDTVAADNLESACDNYSVTRGLSGTALPAVVAGGAGGIPTDSSGKTSFNDIAATAIVSSGAIATNGGAVSNVTTTATATNVTNGVSLANGAVTNASLAENMEIIFETDFATNYNTTNDKWQVDADVTSIHGDPTSAQQLEYWLDTFVYSNLVSGSTTTATLQTATYGDLKGALLAVVSGTGSGQNTTIAEFNDTTDVATLTDTLSTALDGTSNVLIIPMGRSIVDAANPLDVNVVQVAGTVQTANDNGADINAILADTNELQTDDVPGLIAALNDISVADITGVEVDNDGTAISLSGAFKLILSVLTGKSAGGGTTTLTFRNVADTKNRISVTVDSNGNRTAVGTRDAT